ncbi:hypothetical protein LPJ53_001008 [Coemansia erecta]|uniref:Uncharacterized protein n=1 Tax=Coemansia erecta TaxID=147472 RepID=A0A9W7Y7A7_9FUNG|nr:hypothetical protein LPJ53_001008 [Coemansia erecta]
MAFIRLRLSKGKHFGIFTIHRPKLEYHSNVDIIISRGHHTLVNNLFIAANRYMGYSDFFEHVFHILQPEKYEWPGVHNLYINMVADMAEYMNIYADSITVPSESECQQYVDTFHRCMPSVQQLTVHEPYPEKGVFVNKLANQYAHQLNYLTSLNPVSLSETKFCTNLTHLNIKLDPDSKPLYLPQLAAAPLQYLSLINVPPQFSWAEFYDAEGSNITFHKNLWIENCPSDSELLHCQPYFSDMHEVVVEGPVESVALSAEMGLKKQNKLKIYINHASLAQEPLFYTATNQLFSKLDIGRDSCLGIDVGFDRFDVQSILWTGLRKLFVFSSVDVNNFVGLLAALPNLTTTVARRLVVNTDMISAEYGDHSSAPISESQSTASSRTQSISSTAGSHHSRFRRLARLGWTHKRNSSESLHTLHIEPLSSAKMQRMALYFDDDSPGSIELKAMTIGFIIAKFTTLAELQLDPRFEHYICQFVADYANSAPHMPDINIQYAKMHMDSRTFNYYFYSF